MADLTPDQKHSMTCLDATGFWGPFRVDPVSAGLIVDGFGRSLALALPVFDDPDTRRWFADEMAAALNERFGFRSEAARDLQDLKQVAARAESRPGIQARRGERPTPLIAEAQAARLAAVE